MPKVVQVNLDDSPYFGGYLKGNFQQTAAALGLSLAEQRSPIANGFEAAFPDAPTRARYLQNLDAHFGEET